jgi:hypothetical protein
MKDEDAIKRAALDYVEGWYQADGVKMEQALHDQLAKKRVTPEGEVWAVDKEWMVEATRNGHGKLEQPEKGKKEVTLLDKTERMVSVKIESEQFIDYVHLVKDAGEWKIINVLWDYRAE